MFDDAPIGDDFVANCSIPFEDLTENCDIWVSRIVVTLSNAGYLCACALLTLNTTDFI